MKLTRKMSVVRVLLLVSLFISSSQGQGTLLPPEPEGYIDCPLCADATHQVYSYGTFVADSGVITCDQAFEKKLRLPPENCTAWQSYGEDVCRCAAEPPPTNDCRLCDDGGPLPQGSLAGVPGSTCAQLQVDARRDFQDRCPVWQQTMGNYCGCNNTVSDSICRLCGENSTFDASKMVAGQEDNTAISCGELEFSVNLGSTGLECGEYQFIFEDQCCEPVVLPLGDIDGSSTLRSFGLILLTAAAAFLLQ